MGAAAAGPIRTAAAESSGRKHDAMVVGEHTILRVKTWLSLSAAGLLSVGCRPPALIDPLGHPVSRPMLVASLENGRIVIDSSSDGVRAVVELMRTLPDSTYRGEGAIPWLRCSARGSPLAPFRARSEPVTCHEPTGAGCARPEQPNISCAQPNRRIEGTCSQVLHLEYRLDAVPSVGDSLALQLGSRISRSHWTRP